jgi:putative DNA primase/helicase
MNFAKRIDFAALMEPVALKLFGEPNTKLSNLPRDVRFGSRGSLAVNFEDGKWFDHEAKVGGGVLDLISHKTGRNRGEAQAWMKREGIYSLAPLRL